jgi:hypothetical protein
MNKNRHRLGTLVAVAENIIGQGKKPGERAGASLPTVVFAIGMTASALLGGGVASAQTIAPTWNGTNHTTNTTTLSDGSTQSLSSITGTFGLRING